MNENRDHTLWHLRESLTPRDKNALSKEMMTEAVRNLLCGSFDYSELCSLFESLRQPRYSSHYPDIREIGDFIAHPEGRTKGMVQMYVESVATITFDQIIRWHTKIPPYMDPKRSRAYIDAFFNLKNDTDIQEKFRCDKQTIKSRLAEYWSAQRSETLGLRRLPIDTGPFITEAEYLSTYKIGAVINISTLVASFLKLTKDHGLRPKSSRGMDRALLARNLTLFALQTLHQKIIHYKVNGEAHSAQLYLSASTHKPTEPVQINVAISGHPIEPQMLFSFVVFTGDVPTNRIIDRALFNQRKSELTPTEVVSGWLVPKDDKLKGSAPPYAPLTKTEVDSMKHLGALERTKDGRSRVPFDIVVEIAGKTERQKP